MRLPVGRPKLSSQIAFGWIGFGVEVCIFQICF
jgi:hypothetical protein